MSGRRLRAAAVGGGGDGAGDGSGRVLVGHFGPPRAGERSPRSPSGTTRSPSGSCGVPASQSFLTKGVNLFLKTNPGFNVKITQVACDASPAFNTLLKSSEVAGTTPGHRAALRRRSGHPERPVPGAAQQLPAEVLRQLAERLEVRHRRLPGRSPTGRSTRCRTARATGTWSTTTRSCSRRRGSPTRSPRRGPSLVSLAKKLKAKGITPFDIGEKEGYVGAWTQDALISALVGDAGVLKMYYGRAVAGLAHADPAVHGLARAVRRRADQLRRAVAHLLERHR